MEETEEIVGIWREARSLKVARSLRRKSSVLYYIELLAMGNTSCGYYTRKEAGFILGHCHAGALL
jgi:hypothetical protein